MLVSTQVKYIQSLGHKKFRDADGVFIAEGPKVVLELLESTNCTLVQCFATPDWIEAQQQFLKGREKLVVEIEERELKRISLLVTPHQVLAIFKKPIFKKGHGEEGLILLLDTIQDPGNLGTILRTADWFGISLIVGSKETADLFNPKVVQSAMGSIIRLEMIYANLEEYVRSKPGCPLYAATLEGEDLLNNMPVNRGMLLMGNESNGVSPALTQLAIKCLRIPKRGSAESLNVAVAAGILLSRLTAPIQK